MNSVCFVAGGEASPGGPVRIGERLAALASAARGWIVHFLWCGPAADAGFREDKKELEAAGVGVYRLDEVPLPAACRAANGTPGCGPALYASNLIRHAVEALHRARRFDAVVFPSWQAPGFRCVQAKRAGTAFTDVNLVVRLDCISRWLREAGKRWPESDDLFLDYCERYTFDNADIRWCYSEYMLEEAGRCGWDSLPELRAGATAGGEGSPGTVFMDDPPSTPLDRRRTLESLAAGGQLAVFRRSCDTLPPLVRDCIVNGLPFIAARPRWLPGRVTDAAAGPWFFEADAPDAERRLAEAVRLRRCDVPGDDKEDGLDILFRSPSSVLSASAAASPLATIAVTHYNLGRYLPETLASLAAQTYRDVEVLVIDDGSTCEGSCQIWEDQRRLYPQFRFIRQHNAGLGAARNRALSEARGAYFIPVDADNIAAPGMVEAFVRAMRSDPDASAMTCFFLAFRDVADIEKGKFLYQCCPTGGPYAAACAYNVYGDANAVFRADHLRAVGGFTVDRSTYCHDWETFVKLAQAGRRIGVVPEHLFCYRRRPDGMSAVMSGGGSDVYPFIQRMLTTFFSGEATVEARTLWTMLAGSLLQGRREPPQPWTLRRLCRGAARRIGALFRPATPQRVGHLVSDPLAHLLVHQTAVVAAGNDLDDGVASQGLE
jgi:glycosyl transferase family 2